MKTTIFVLLNLSFATVGPFTSYLIVNECKALLVQRSLKQRPKCGMHLVQLANPREQLLLWFCQVTLEIYVKLVSSKPFQKHLNVVNIAICLLDALRTGRFSQGRPSLDLREDQNGGCNDRD